MHHSTFQLTGKICLSDEVRVEGHVLRPVLAGVRLEVGLEKIDINIHLATLGFT